jgi:hypothetical protein
LSSPSGPFTCEISRVACESAHGQSPLRLLRSIVRLRPPGRHLRLASPARPRVHRLRKLQYAKLFSGPAIVRVAFHHFEAQGNNDFHLFVGREKGYCETTAVRLELRIRTSRWFVKMRGVWRQLHHHRSIDEPALLADYQRAILGTPLGASVIAMRCKFQG